MFRPSPAAPTVTRRGAQTPAAPSIRKSSPAPETTASESPPRPPSELGPIIKAKIQPPALRTTTLSRQRLIDQLRDAAARRLTLLVAEAGYGKTTLLADFARATDTRVVWYRLDSTDADVVDWVSYLVAAFREVEPGFGQATVDLLGEIPTGGPPKSAFLASLISELGG